MKRKIAIVVITYQIIVFILFACDCPVNYYPYLVNDFKIVNLDKYEKESFISTSKTNYDNYSIAINFTTSKYVKLIEPINLGNKAYAMYECEEIDNYEIQNKIKSIDIVSNIDFDNSHKAGISLNEYFTPYTLRKKCNGDFDGCSRSFESYDNLIEVFNDSFTSDSYEGSIWGNDDLGQIFILDLIKNPENKSERNFTIKIEFEDGLIITSSTEIILIE